MAESAAELQANLAEYREQLQQLEDLLLDEPDNADYQSLFNDVQEAIALTEAALREEAQADGSAAHGVAGDDAAEAGPSSRKRKSRFDASSGGAAGALPVQVLDQIRAAKARSALEGSAPMGWALGFPCLARDSAGHWQPAQVRAVTADGQFEVAWDGSGGVSSDGGTTVVHKVDARPRDTGNYRGVSAPTRKAVGEVSKDAYERYLKGETTAVPKWMQIQEGDSEKVKEKKQKALKALKKKRRFEQKDLQSTKQANDWKSFREGKGSKKKSGFMTGAKKESMFAVPDNPNSKVGVVGSGRGMTDASYKRTRLDF